MSIKNALLVDDSPLQLEGMRNILISLGYEVVDCCDAETALDILQKTDFDFSLIAVDKAIPERPGEIAREYVGAHLIRNIAEAFPFVGYLVLYTSLSDPNVGDIRQVYRAGASALAAPSGSDRETIIKALEMIASGHQVLSPRFRQFGAQALDPESQCPLDPVEYYCVRLICEHRGKEGAANKWGAGISTHIIDDLMEDVYAVMSQAIEGFEELPKEKKPVKLCEWYHDVAIQLYGAAAQVPYESRSQRRRKWWHARRPDEGNNRSDV